MTPFGAGGFEIVFFAIWLLFVLGGIAGWLAVVIAIWRLMTAHEKLAEAVQRMAANSSRDQSR